MPYENRLLLYADILGWKAELLAGDAGVAQAAMECLHAPAEFHSEIHRQAVLKRAKGTGSKLRVNPTYLAVQFGSFSDHFVYSTPEDYGGSILNAASQVTRILLSHGLLVRGAIVSGPLVHRDNVVYGPALIRAVDMEQREAFYPRILVAQEVAEDYFDEDELDASIIKDQMGRVVVNPFALPFKADPPYADAALESFMKMNTWLPRRSAMQTRIDRLREAGNDRAAEKWRYMENFISGPAIAANPELHKYWK